MYNCRHYHIALESENFFQERDNCDSGALNLGFSSVIGVSTTDVLLSKLPYHRHEFHDLYH